MNSIIRKNISSVKKIEHTEVWIKWAKILTPLIAGGGIVLHFLGHIAHVTYLSQFGIDTELFQKSIYWNEVYGYYTSFERLSSFTMAIIDNGLKFLYLGFICIIYIFALFLLSGLKKSGRIRLEKFKFPEWIKHLIVSVTLVGILFIFIPLTLIATTILWGLPGLIAESYGKSEATRNLSIFLKGCNSLAKNYSCIELRKNKENLSRGFLIDSSEKHIAIFDIDKKQAQIFERKDTEYFVFSSDMIEREIKKK